MRATRFVSVLLLCTFTAVLGYSLRWCIDYRENLAAAKALIAANEQTLLAWQMGTAHAPPLPPGEVAPGQAVHDDLRLYLQATKSRYVVGENVMIRVVLANASPDSLIVPRDISVPKRFLHLVVTRDGSPVSPNTECVLGSGLIHPCQFLQLRPHETYGFVDSISTGWNGFDLSQPGSYSVHAEYTVFIDTANGGVRLFQGSCDSFDKRHGWSGSIKSESVGFIIVME